MTAELVEFPDIVGWVCAYLRAGLAANGHPGVRVADRKGTAGTEVWVQRDGGPTLDVVRERALIRTNCFKDGASTQPVDALALRVDTLLRAAEGEGPVIRARRLAGPSPIEDPTGRPRRYQLHELTVRGAAL